ncbi:MAG TPA: tail fiber assembly protein [Scandinavium sp.]|jgi:hypothetical protein
MAKATLNKNGIATKAGDMTVYNFDGENREFISSTVEFISVGVGLPASACIDAPLDTKDGFAVCRTAGLDGWEYIEDHRGETVYDTETGQIVAISAPGEYADTVTTIAPSTPYDRWNGDEWVTDKSEQQQGQIQEADQKKAALLSEAKNTISLWQTELQLGIISDEDKASLIAWMQYIQALKAVDTSVAPDIKWPVKPE